MSHSKIRNDKRCQNCGHFVAGRFCPECGQENVETRRRFHYLFVHFIRDFVHYDSKFWHTIMSLLLPTAKLSKDYLAGKRKSQVNPVQLYIFISFVVFFVPHILPDFDEHPEKKNVENSAEMERGIKIGEDTRDQIWDVGIRILGLSSVKSIEQLDSLQQTLPKNKKISFVKYTLAKKILSIKEMGMRGEGDILKEAFIHNFSKAIFLYMPIFAFWLWVFHSKKKWFYFDHGIYTLHYFSFILLSILLYIIADWLCSLFHGEVYGLITVAIFLYFIYYFFHSHRRMYRESKAVSRLICIALFFINMFCMALFLVVYAIAVFLIAA